MASKLAYTMFQVKSVSTWTVLIIKKKKNFRPNMSGLKFLSDFENVAECKVFIRLVFSLFLQIYL